MKFSNCSRYHLKTITYNVWPDDLTFNIKNNTCHLTVIKIPHLKLSDILYGNIYSQNMWSGDFDLKKHNGSSFGHIDFFKWSLNAKVQIVFDTGVFQSPRWNRASSSFRYTWLGQDYTNEPSDVLYILTIQTHIPLSQVPWPEQLCWHPSLSVISLKTKVNHSNLPAVVCRALSTVDVNSRSNGLLPTFEECTESLPKDETLLKSCWLKVTSIILLRSCSNNVGICLQVVWKLCYQESRGRLLSDNSILTSSTCTIASCLILDTYIVHVY